LFSQETVGKRLGLLHELVPKAVRVAVLVDPLNATAETTSQQVQEAARTIGLRIQILNASTSGEIDAAFATPARERLDALFVAADVFFLSRRVQFATLAARERIPAAYQTNELVPNPIGHDWPRNIEASNEARRAAIRDLIADGIVGIFALASLVKEPGLIGRAIAQVGDDTVVDEVLARGIRAGDDWSWNLAHGVIVTLVNGKGDKWGDRLIDKAVSSRWEDGAVLADLVVVAEVRAFYADGL
jgi:hypothetical protein